MGIGSQAESDEVGIVSLGKKTGLYSSSLVTK
jgi:hypothetical protein